MLHITFLGTSGMVPTKERNVQGIYLEFDGEGILVDCGEGTQRQMNIAGINRNKVRKVLISHWHGDHVSGLIGLIQTVGNALLNKDASEVPRLEIYGPTGTKEHMHHLLNSCIFELKVDLQVIELNPRSLERFIDREKYAIDCIHLDHSTPCLGFRFVEKSRRRIDLKKASELGLEEGPALGELSRGKKISWKGAEVHPDDVTVSTPERKVSFILDTAICAECYQLAENADILVSEAAFSSELEHKAEQYKHMTAKQAAQIASRAGVKKLILTHLSQRYKTPEQVLDDAAGVFENVEVAYDFMSLTI